MTDALVRVKRATKKRDRVRAQAEAEWRAAIRAAHAEGASLRVIGAAAGVSNVYVLRVVREG